MNSKKRKTSVNVMRAGNMLEYTHCLWLFFKTFLLTFQHTTYTYTVVTLRYVTLLYVKTTLHFCVHCLFEFTVFFIIVSLGRINQKHHKTRLKTTTTEGIELPTRLNTCETWVLEHRWSLSVRRPPLTWYHHIQILLSYGRIRNYKNSTSWQKRKAQYRSLVRIIDVHILKYDRKCIKIK